MTPMNNIHTSTRPHRSRARRGFTLVELLVVITIIAILASLVGFAAFSALETAKVTRLVVETKNLETNLDVYKSERNDYPPDATDAVRVRRHVTNSYQRLAQQELFYIDDMIANGTQLLVNDRTGQPRSLSTLQPPEALVFWLSQLYDHNQYPVTGVRNASGVPTAKRKVFFEFPVDRLRDDDGDGWDEFYPSTRHDEPPYVYFHNQTYAQASYPYGNKGVAIAYLSDQRELTNASLAPFNYYQFANPKKFQIICPGLDGRYNSRNPPPPLIDPLTYPRFPSGLNPNETQGYDMAGGELDNITNFSEGQLEDKIDR